MFKKRETESRMDASKQLFIHLFVMSPKLSRIQQTLYKEQNKKLAR